MRLSPREIEGIKIAVQFFTLNAKLYLYGSRVDPLKKGGDIDLVLAVFTEQDKSNLLSQKHLILSKMKAAIGDQKIDLAIITEDELQTNAFFAFAADPTKRVEL